MLKEDSFPRSVSEVSSLVSEPYSAYRIWRLAGPLRWTDQMFGGAWLLTTFEGVEAALRDPRLSAKRTGGWIMRCATGGRSERRELLAFQRVFSRAMLFLDKPQHPLFRQAIQAGFRQDALQRLQPFINQTIEELLDNIEKSTIDDQPFDFIEKFARILPTKVISKVLGLDNTDKVPLREWSTDLALFLGTATPSFEDAKRAQRGIIAMRSYFEECLARAECKDGNDIISLLLRADAIGQAHRADELLAQCAMLLFAGHETTRHLLGTVIYWLLHYSNIWQALRSDPSLVNQAVRELLRWDSPIQYTGRRAAFSLELYGQKIRRGELVIPLIGSANRDPSRYPNPDQIRLDRQLGLPLSFGSGPHACIGATLTLMEAEATVRAVLRRWPQANLVSTMVEWINSPLYRGLVALPLRRRPAAA